MIGHIWFGVACAVASASGLDDCDVDACLARCDAKYGGHFTDGGDTKYCSKGCALISHSTIEDRDFICKKSVEKRYSFCISNCDQDSTSKDRDNQKTCEWGCGFWQSSPSPSPTPSPTPSPPPSPSPSPTPSPSALPDIPDVDVWVGFWGAKKAALDVSSLAFGNSWKTGDPWKKTEIDKYGGGGLRFLYPVFRWFCKENDETGKCTLYDNYEDRWNEHVPEMTQLLKDGKIIGFSLGDERVCSNGKHGTSVKDLTKMVDTVRASFPDRKKAIIHMNECGSTFGDRKDSCKDAAMTDVPSGLDWISIDHYRKDKTDDGFMDDLKNYHKQCIYPKMHSEQQICIIPGTTSNVCPNEKTCLQDAKYAVKWAESDEKVACITPYRWDDMYDVDDGEWTDLIDYWKTYARKSRPGVQNATVV